MLNLVSSRISGTKSIARCAQSSDTPLNHRTCTAATRAAALAASTKLQRRFGPWRFRKGRYGDALIAHLENLQVLGAARRVQHDAIAGSRLHQRGGQRRQPADVIAIQIDLVAADDAHGSFGSSGVDVAHRGAEKDLRGGAPTSGRFRV